jgi:serine/threonine-protein kinase
MSPAFTIAHYRVTAKLGEGGMGAVYRATDTKLNRDVAIKILPDAFAGDAERMARFAREAQVLASLNHPNIAAIYGTEERALVMELVEGPTLAERLAASPIPVPEALTIARQIAEALEAAHEKGVVHRDLKPSNVKITPDGVVKVLDFGLAKSAANSVAAPAGDSTNRPTITISPTRAGMILGTAAYMSPEQVRGEPVDKRADIWAFGVSLYEMLTGTRMFRGESVSDVLAAVLRAEPDWSALPAETPPSVVRLLRRCLERNRKKRLRDIGDARLELDETQDTLPEIAEGPPRKPLRWLAAALIGGLLLGLGLSRLRPAPERFPRPVSRWTAVLPTTAASDIALSRDGEHLVYAAARGGADSLFLESMDRQDIRPLPGTAAAVGPAFSPDGQWIAFYEGERLAKVAISGGPPITICKAPGQRGRTWGDDDTIVFGTVDGGLMRVPAAGGIPQPLTTPDRRKGETGHWWPYFLPGAEAVLFTIVNSGSNDASQIAVLDLRHRSYRTVANGGANGRYAPSGHLVFGRSGKLFAAPFDARRLVVTGPEVPVIQEIAVGNLGTARYAFCDSGLLVYLGGGRRLKDRTLEWVDRQGIRRPAPLPARLYNDISLSPDGRRVAASIGGGGGSDIWIGDLERGTLTPLTSENSNFSPVWTPDGRRITFASHDPKQLLKQVTADGSGRSEVLLDGVTQMTPLSWTPRGDLLFLSRESGLMRISLLAAPVNGVENKPRHLLEAGFGEGHEDGHVSPDDHWVAYSSNESGRFEIYVRSFPELGGKVPVSSQGGQSPRWSRDGRELLYWDPVKDQVMAVEVQTASDFRAAQPRPLFTLHSPGPGSQGLYRGWDVSRDGNRFLVVSAPDASETGASMQAVVNWFEELRRMAPPAK